MHQQLPPEQLDRLICLEARIHKKSKEEIIQEQFLQIESEKQTDENDRNKQNMDSNKKSDDLKCSQNSENSPQKLFTSQNLSPVQKKSIITKKHSQQKKKKKTKEGQQKDITQYLQYQKKQQKAKKCEQKLMEYSIQDSPFKNKSPLPSDPALEKQLKEKQNQIAISEIKIKELETHNSELRETISSLTEQQLRIQDVVKQFAIENEKLKKQQLQVQLQTNRVRLGEYVVQREKTALVDVWIDGQELREAKEQSKRLEVLKAEYENKKKNSKNKEEQEMRTLNVKLNFLIKEEQQLQETVDRLETEKNLHIKQLKRVYEEEHARFTKNNDYPLIGERYQVLSLLGKGGFSEVYKAYDLQELREVACKIHQLNSNWSDHAKQNYIRHAIRENRVHKELNHPHIVKLYDSVEIDKSSFCTVLELCDGPDLAYYIKKYKCFPEKEAKLLVGQIISAIKYLNNHKNKIIHYDLKPQNILFHLNELKISDFGLCKVLEDDNSKLQLTSQGVGTYWYLPPECFHMGDQPPNISSKVDIWSIGVIFFEMLFGQKPFGQGVSQEKILKEQIIVKSQSVTFPQKPIISNECKEFIRGCLAYNQVDRLDVHQASNHPYFQKKLN
ncbi:unnamed protein product (macronuclear) [Paramecium tetraurelia]|uniref:Protein kinase domain-containing protein n=1 Tax=Paramecium tetraurelia TaxID=5888 RepID=A0CKN9_PARTE|nr:uncharacterized protein GSPATT00001070001 [Paramecium tetraurelia]CAK71356.1 unnamed protein product [Paramecium tetraurelia]|eukprot:XP_001438753.1 hypothetical protein (macronuclear) [Paramecium tetraurelia strain d4-2]